MADLVMGRGNEVGKPNNATMSFRGLAGKLSTARVRVVGTSYSFGVNSVESHSRTERAFYPHRRSLGQFTLVIESLGYKEYRAFNNWLRFYADALRSGQVGNRKGSVPMEVLMPARHFHKVGILTSGIDEHDNTGSMVFTSNLVFMMLKDFNDPGTAIVDSSQTSYFVAPRSQNVYTGEGVGAQVKSIIDASGTKAFYPTTVASYKDTDTAIYDLGEGNVPGGPLGGGIHIGGTA